MAFQQVCKLDDLWEGEMQSFVVAGHEVLVIRADGGMVRAVQATCPHQEIPLVEGALQGHSLMCRAHLWQFDISTGQSINPEGCKLALYPVRLEQDTIFVDVEGVTPFYSAA
jgi:toluene monooxygenase system ferredoxin subunit